MKICNRCNTEKSNKSFTANNRWPDNLERTCRECVSVRRKELYDPERARLAWIKNKYSGPEHAESRRLMAAYGISVSIRDFMIKKANRACEICADEVKLVVDHDHGTGIIRGMLCSKCNRGLGHFNDNEELLLRAMLYLQIKSEMNNTNFK